jgi:SAM-dependent methyltransferase
MTATDVKRMLDHATNERGVAVLAQPSPFEAIYGRVRRAENRILTDEQVRRLPDGSGLWNAKEWRIRRASAERLTSELDRHGRTLNILEVGCGNGWLAAFLNRAGHTVMGIDVFTEELEQAARVFEGPLFARADLFRSPLPESRFDAVIFAASFQYFSDAAATLERSRRLLVPNGEVHVLDTVLYSGHQEARRAMDRSDHYYTGLGAPEMTGRYHAHVRTSLERSGGARILASPSPMRRMQQALGRNPSPFTHIAFAR